MLWDLSIRQADLNVLIVYFRVRKSLGIRREMMVTGLTRLIPTECEVGGWPPLSVTFSNEEDRREVLGRAGSLVADRKSNIQITEDMSRQDRQGWCELQRFMLRVMDRYPNSKVRLARERLTVDSRVFVWDRLSGKVDEQRVVTIPIQGDILTSTNGTATRYVQRRTFIMWGQLVLLVPFRAPNKIQIDDISLNK